jgi:K+-sensing histidine kinase KdpD
LSKNDLVEFTIQDNGIGIPKNELYDIFTPFKMGSNTESKADGRGIGLALCKASIEAHGGAISATSKGIGAQFRFVLRR